MGQFRLVHVGVAAVLAAATVAAVGLVQSVTAATGSASSFVPITPCRLVDTRPGSDHVGTRATPIGANEAVTLAVWGTNGNCTIPNTATGIATNTTAVNPTAGSFLTVYPADANPRPTASNLNFVAGSPPTPNQVTVGLSAAGAIGVYNLTGTVDVIVDIVGYYQRESSSGGASGDHSLLISPVGFAPDSGSDLYTLNNSTLSPVTAQSCYMKPIALPVGATVTLLSVIMSDNSASGSAVVQMWSTPAFNPVSTVMAVIATTDAGTPGQISAGNNSIAAATISASNFYTLQFCGWSGTNFKNASIDYTLP
jgi:hypothetical protein